MGDLTYQMTKEQSEARVGGSQGCTLQRWTPTWHCWGRQALLIQVRGVKATREIPRPTLATILRDGTTLSCWLHPK